MHQQTQSHNSRTDLDVLATALAERIQLSNASPWMNTAEAGEAYANLRQPNQYATLCWIGAAIVLFGSLPLRRSVRIPR